MTDTKECCFSSHNLNSQNPLSSHDMTLPWRSRCRSATVRSTRTELIEQQELCRQDMTPTEWQCTPAKLSWNLYHWGLPAQCTLLNTALSTLNVVKRNTKFVLLSRFLLLPSVLSAWYAKCAWMFLHCLHDIIRNQIKLSWMCAQLCIQTSWELCIIIISWVACCRGVGQYTWLDVRQFEDPDNLNSWAGVLIFKVAGFCCMLCCHHVLGKRANDFLFRLVNGFCWSAGEERDWCFVALRRGRGQHQDRAIL